MTTANEKAPDQHALQALVVAEQASGTPEIHSLVVAPSAGGTCDATYTSMRYHDNSCAAVRETAAAGFRFLEDLGNYPTYVRGNAEYLTLFPLPRGCLAVRSGISY
jgi:hypothetical protein